VSFELIVTLVAIVVAVVLFVSERLPVGQVAMLLMTGLLLTGVIAPAQAFAGFSNVATVTVGAMFVISAGVYRTGAVNAVGSFVGGLLRTHFWLAMVAICVGVAVMSAFVNNTAVVAIFLPILIGCARDAGISPSKVLIPMSFAAVLGGVCTLIGTSTNLLVSSIAEDSGLEGFGMFEFAPLGLVFAACGITFIVAVGVYLLPRRRGTGTLTESLEMGRYVTDVRITERSPSVGYRVAEAPLIEGLDCDVLTVYRNGIPTRLGPRDHVLVGGDILRLRCSIADISKIVDQDEVHLATGELADAELHTHETVVVEAVVGPRTPIEGRSIADIDFPSSYGAVVLALRKHGELRREELRELRVRAGDVLLMAVDRAYLEAFRRHRDFVLVSQAPFSRFRTERIPVAVGILIAVVGAASLGLMPIAAAAVCGGVLMLLSGCLTQSEAIEALDWNVLFLLAGVLSLGEAMQSSGADQLLAAAIIEVSSRWGEIAMISCTYLASTLLTSVMSNNGTAALLAPIAIAGGQALGLDPRGLLMAVTFGASTSFLTPVGYQANTMVYGAGHYRFTDFARVGLPLTVILWALATVFIPVLWPLAP
jgi:di/tricarboxylate transporter